MEEILIDILSRLPVQSLVRFKCVSKIWKTLISQPYFKKKHLNHAKNQLSSKKLLFLEWAPNRHLWSSSLSLVQLAKDIRILIDCPSNSNPAIGMKVYCSCDGLFLIGIWSKHLKQPSILVIWNPSTKESVVLTHSKFPRQIEDYADDDDYDYDYDDEEDHVGSTYGLAYDTISDDYKIFRIDLYEGYEILALKNDSWRIIDKTSAGRTNSTMLSGGECLAFVHGAFHWLGSLSRKFCLVSFNISDEMFGEISLPEIVCSQIHSEIEVDVDVGVSVLAGMLGVYYKDDKAFNLWVMKNYGIKDSWMKLFTIPSTGVYSIIPKYMFPNNEVLLCFRVDRVTTRFGLSDRMWPPDYDDIGAVTIDGDGFLCTESLISPKLGHVASC